MHIRIVSLFPEMVASVAEYGVVGRAVARGLVSIGYSNPRDFTDDVHRTVDDRPYGGGPGMVMKFEPAAAAIRETRQTMPDGCRVICLSPQGAVFDKAAAERLAQLPGLILLAGRYEGIDERLIEAEVDEEISLGDFVLSGGEIAAMAVIDAVARLIPGVLGDEDSAAQDSFSEGLLDCPHYTRPEDYLGDVVPAVLMNGNHREIDSWREQQALGRTWQRRPDLLKQATLDSRQQALLDDYITEFEQARKR